MQQGREKKIYKTFVASTLLTLAAGLALIFYFMFGKTQDLIYENNLIEARSAFQAVSVIRLWNVKHGGVYVEKRPGVEPGPFIKDSEIRTSDGRVFVRLSHAVMGREIARYSAREGVFDFHVTGRRPLDPQDRPDAFEERSLKLFEKGQREVSEIYSRDRKTYFRYMAPVFVQEECMPCHGGQGYKPGDIIGGVSVSFEIGHIQKKLRDNATLIVTIAFAASSLLLGLIYLFTRRLIEKTSAAMEEVRRIASTDELTGLLNRKHILLGFSEEFERAKGQGRELGCIIVKINNFREINDRYGHLFGDDLIRRIAVRIKGLIRETDLLGKYSGPEFLIVLPDTGREAARAISRKLRSEMKDESAKEIPLSVSICLTTLREEDRYVDDLTKRVDEMLRSQSCTDPDSCECV